MTEAEKRVKAIRLYDNWCETDTEDTLEIYCYEKGREDAIQEFVELINTMPTYENEYGEKMPMPIEMMAEQLKEKKE